MRPTLTVGLFFILYAATTLADERPCTIHDSGKFYDLNTLKNSKDYIVAAPNRQNISLNVCQNVKTELWGVKDGIEAKDVAAFVRRGHGDFVLGKVTTELGVLDGRPRLTLSDGSACKTSSGSETEIKASTVVDFICDKTIFGPGTPRLLAQLPPGDDERACAYFIEWRTHHACPTSEGGFWWTLFVVIAVIFFVLLITYTVLGTLYNRFVLQLRGVDQIPQFSVESMKYHASEAFDWMKDIVSMWCAGSGSGNSLYGRVPNGSNADRGPRVNTNPVSHHIQSTSIRDGDAESQDTIAPTNGSFVRPQSNGKRANAFQRFETNPVSHQTQVNAELSLSSPQRFQSPQQPAPSTPPRDIPQPPRRAPEPLNEERDFMLGDDEDAEELGDVTTPMVSRATSNPASPPETPRPPPTGSGQPSITRLTRGDA